MNLLLASIVSRLSLGAAPVLVLGATPDAPAAAQPAAITLTQDQLDALLAKAVAGAVARMTPVSSAQGAGVKVRLKHDTQPPHGDPIDRVGTLGKVLRRVIHRGNEEELFAVTFQTDAGPVVEEHVSSALEPA